MMKALQAFQKAHADEAKLNKKTVANEENREKHYSFYELKKQLMHDKMMAAACRGKEVKYLHLPIIKEESN